MWDDLQGHVLAAMQAKRFGNPDAGKAALAQIAATRAKFTKALERYYESAFAPLKNVIDQLEAGNPVSEKVLWTLPVDHTGTNPPQTDFTGLNIATANGPIMIEIEAKCDRFEVAHIAWASSEGYKPGQEMEFIAGYPGHESPTYRVTIAPHSQPITALRLHFPGTTIDLKQLRIHEISVFSEEPLAFSR